MTSISQKGKLRYKRLSHLLRVPQLENVRARIHPQAVRSQSSILNHYIILFLKYRMSTLIMGLF